MHDEYAFKFLSAGSKLFAVFLNIDYPSDEKEMTDMVIGKLHK